MKPKLTTIRTLGSWAVYAVVFAVVLELCARIDDSIKYDAPFSGVYSNQRLRANDDENIRHNIPNGSFEKWRNNNLGFRGPDIELEKPEGTSRVICMGTSETYGLYESTDNEWPAQLSRLLEPAGHYEVINTATVGLKRENLLRYLEKYVYKLQPDIVILIIFPNFVERDDPANSPVTKPPTVKATQSAGGGFSLSAIKQRIRIIPKIWQVIKRFVPTWLLEKYQYQNRSQLILDMERRYLKDKKPIDKISQEGLQSFKSDMEVVIRDLKARGIEVVLTTYPFLMNEDNVDKYPLIFMEARRFSIELSYQGMIDASLQANRLMRELAEQENTGLIDCYAAVPQDTDHFADNVHLTDKGAEIIADLMAKYIIAHQRR